MKKAKQKATLSIEDHFLPPCYECEEIQGRPTTEDDLVGNPEPMCQFHIALFALIDFHTGEFHNTSWRNGISNGRQMASCNTIIKRFFENATELLAEGISAATVFKRPIPSQLPQRDSDEYWANYKNRFYKP